MPTIRKVIHSVIGFLLGGIMGVSACSAAIDTTHAIIHHTASSDKSAIKIHEEHKLKTWEDKRGNPHYWWGIGYHFVIRADGNVEEGRPIHMKGAHARGSRNWKVGIALTGWNDFTPAQISSLKKLLIKLKTTIIERHSNTCPGPGLDVSALAEDLGIKQRGIR